MYDERLHSRAGWRAMKDYCKMCKHDEDIGFCDKCFYNHVLGERGIPPTEYEAKSKPITNADRIRAMSDEELARFMWNCAQPCCPPINCAFKKCDAEKCWLKWLKQEANDE